MKKSNVVANTRCYAHLFGSPSTCNTVLHVSTGIRKILQSEAKIVPNMVAIATVLINTRP